MLSRYFPNIVTVKKQTEQDDNALFSSRVFLHCIFCVLCIMEYKNHTLCERAMTKYKQADRNTWINISEGQINTFLPTVLRSYEEHKLFT